MIITAIAAVSVNGVIGSNGSIPWNQPRDMDRFRHHTMNKPVIMGRRTFESIPGGPLPGRTNIVLTRSQALYENLPKLYPGVQVAHDIQRALFLARQTGSHEAMIAGGGEVYRETIPLWDRLLLTIVDVNVSGDTMFPADEVAKRGWYYTETLHTLEDSRNKYQDLFIDYRVDSTQKSSFSNINKNLHLGRFPS